MHTYFLLLQKGSVNPAAIANVHDKRPTAVLLGGSTFRDQSCLLFSFFFFSRAEGVKLHLDGSVAGVSCDFVGLSIQTCPPSIELLAVLL